MLDNFFTRKQVLVKSRITHVATICIIKHKDNTSTAGSNIFAPQISPIKN